MLSTDLPIRAATEAAIAHGITPDRCDILQNSSTLVLRLTETLVARVVQDRDGPRQGTEWFARENSIAQHLTRHGAPTIPLHPDLPPGPHEQMLWDHLSTSIDVLSAHPHQPLHGDAHMGNLMNTTRGLLWTDWEDTFAGPVEWDVASIIWNAQILEEDHATVQAILDSYGPVNNEALNQSLIGRAAVMTAWYPILYPNPNEERQRKLRSRIEWLEKA
jgi:aminoglycoside/choline kinase family phosphotransferase